jgi:folate-binding protein YgfZ
MISPSNLRIFRYRPGAWLQVRGEDARQFLQGQFTQDLSGLAPGQSAYGLWLNQKGKIMADSFVIAGAAAGEFWVGSYGCAGAAIAARLEGYIVADDVAVTDETAAWEGVSVLGAGGGEWAQSARPSGSVLFPARRGNGENWECLWPVESSALMTDRLAGLAAASAEEMERERIAAGIPAIPRDAGPGDLPPEAGLEGAAISYTKGCYLGQEVIARLKSRGRTRRRLRRVAGSGTLPALPAELGWEGKKIGELRSAIGGVDGGSFSGLAMVAADLPLDAALRFFPEREGTAGAAAALRFCV